MHTIDWLLVIIPLAAVMAVAFYTKRYVRSVADFLAGGRCAGRYLLANARGESDAGLANTMSKFEIIMVSGFVLTFWEKISTPIILLVGISGFVIYRFRETRAFTLAQFLEMRYSRAFRLYMGMLAFVSGILNYGIFPAVSSRFFIYFLDLPHHIPIAGLSVPTFELIMLCYLSLTVYILLVGGQVTMMVTDCLEGIFSHLIYVVIALAVFFIVSWGQIMQVMESAPPRNSPIDPFDAQDVEDFNIWFVLMALLLRVYTTMALQNKQGFNAAAKSPHESRMGAVLGEWRTYARNLMLLVLGICAMTFIQHDAFSQQAAPVHAQIASIEDPYIAKQMTVPIALSHLLPIGIKGLFVAIMIMGLIAGDSGHMHSWGSIFVQDVILPLKKNPMSPRQHIWALRVAVACVAIFAFLFSILFTQTQYIALWWALTMGVFTSGAGAAIIGGLYWKKGTTSAAWSAAITGSVISFVGIGCGSFWPSVKEFISPLTSSLGLVPPEKFWFNNMVSAFIAACTAALVYIVVSLLTAKREYNLDKLLHRGQYAVEASGTVKRVMTLRERFTLRNILRFDSNFTLTDKIVSGGIFWWAMFLLAVNIFVTVWNLGFERWTIHGWAIYWMGMGIAVPCVIAIGTLVWFGIGGIKDIRAFFIALRTMTRDATDDGRVEKSDQGAFPVGPKKEDPSQTNKE